MGEALPISWLTSSSSFAKLDSGYTVPIALHTQQKGDAVAATGASPEDAPRGIASVYGTAPK